MNQRENRRKLTIECLEGRRLLATGSDLEPVDDLPAVFPQATPSVDPAADASHIILATERIYNPVSDPDVVTIRSGAWSDPTIWSTNQAPQSGDRVRISAGTTVRYDVQSDHRLRAVGIESGAALRFADDRSTRLHVGDMVVFAGGLLEVGTADRPIMPHVTAEIVIADQPLDFNLDPEQHGTGIIGLGRVTMHGASKDRTWIRLRQEPRAGDRQLVLEQSVTGWRVGDTVVLPDTRQVPERLVRDDYLSKIGAQWEESTIVGIDGDVLTLASPLRFDHLGGRDADGVLQVLPHVALIDRNVIVRSENPEGTRGHVLLAGRAEVDIRYARFSELGRTRQDVMANDTVFFTHLRNTDGGKRDGDLYRVTVSNGRAEIDKSTVLPREWTAELVADQLEVRDAKGNLRTVQVVQDELIEDGSRLLRVVELASDRSIELVASSTGVRSRFAFAPSDSRIRYHADELILTRRNGTLIPTLRELDWQVQHIGTNQHARYSLHAHHLSGPVNPDNTGHQFQWIGNTVDGFLKWGFVVHGSSYGLVQDNVAYAGGGAAYVTEDGSEIENAFRRNISLVTTGTGGIGSNGAEHERGNFGREGSGFWARSTGNFFEGNVAANATGSGFTISGYYLKDRALPLFRGARTHHDDESRVVSNNPPGMFRNNEVYGMTADGIWSAHTSGADNEARREHPIHFQDTRIWHVHRKAMEFYHTSQIKIDGFQILFDPQVSVERLSSRLLGPIGINVTAYANNLLEIRNGTVANGIYGIISASTNDGGSESQFARAPAIIENVQLANYRNITVRPPHSPRGKGLEIRNPQFQAFAAAVPTTTPPGWNIGMDYKLDAPLAAAIAPDLVYVFGYNGVAGDDFQLFYEQQAADFVNPFLDATNGETWQQQGISLGGQIATGAIRRHGIHGRLDPDFQPRPTFLDITLSPIADDAVSLQVVTMQPAKLWIEVRRRFGNQEPQQLGWTELGTTHVLEIASLTPSKRYILEIRAISLDDVLNTFSFEFRLPLS